MLAKGSRISKISRLGRRKNSCNEIKEHKETWECEEEDRLLKATSEEIKDGEGARTDQLGINVIPIRYQWIE